MGGVLPGDNVRNSFDLFRRNRLLVPGRFPQRMADSLDIVQIMVKIEDTYDIELVDEDMQKITDIKGFIAYIEKKIAEKN